MGLVKTYVEHPFLRLEPLLLVLGNLLETEALPFAQTIDHLSEGVQ